MPMDLLQDLMNDLMSDLMSDLRGAAAPIDGCSMMERLVCIQLALLRLESETAAAVFENADLRRQNQVRCKPSLSAEGWNYHLLKYLL